MGERSNETVSPCAPKFTPDQCVGENVCLPRRQINPRLSNCREALGRGDLMMEKKGEAAFAAMERALKAEARRFVADRAALPPPDHAVPSMLSMLGCGMKVAATDLYDPAIANPLVARLRKALRQERTKARAGHSGYDFSRHVALHQMLKHIVQACPTANGRHGLQSGEESHSDWQTGNRH
jgi:hypothetical protein